MVTAVGSASGVTHNLWTAVEINHSRATARRDRFEDGITTLPPNDHVPFRRGVTTLAAQP
jgi:hypothetical protein